MNPVLLVEVTSRSTEDYERGDKHSHYKQIPALKAVIIAAHETRCLTVVTRTATGWEMTDYRGGERVKLETPALELGVDEVYSVLQGL